VTQEHRALRIKTLRLFSKLTFSFDKQSVFIPQYLNHEKCKITDILKTISPDEKTGGALYHRLRRRFKFLSRSGLVTIDQGDKIDWTKTEKARMDKLNAGIREIFKKAIKDTPPFSSTGTITGDGPDIISTVSKNELNLYVGGTVKLLTLLKQVQNSNRDQKPQNLSPGERIYLLPSKARPERIEAAKELLQVTPDLWDNREETGEKGKARYPAIARHLKNTGEQFDIYNEDIKNRRILLADQDLPGRTVQIPYLTRFNDHKRKALLLDRFDESFSKASASYDIGIFLTLTTAPRFHKTLWHAGRHFSRAWNRYLSLVSKRRKAARRDKLRKAGHSPGEVREDLKKWTWRYRYIQGYEFTDSGLLHSHAVLFGIHWIGTFDQVREDWRRSGQGSRIHAYKVRKDNKGIWKWDGEAPRDSRNRDPVDYIKKYIKKALFTVEGFHLWWTLNKRFYTASRVFAPAPDEIRPSSGRFKFLGSWRLDEIPYAIVLHVLARPVGDTDLEWPKGTKHRPGEPAGLDPSWLPGSVIVR
jgi:hypothetical protein